MASWAISSIVLSFLSISRSNVSFFAFICYEQRDYSDLFDGVSDEVRVVPSSITNHAIIVIIVLKIFLPSGNDVNVNMWNCLARVRSVLISSNIYSTSCPAKNLFNFISYTKKIKLFFISFYNFSLKNVTNILNCDLKPQFCEQHHTCHAHTNFSYNIS